MSKASTVRSKRDTTSHALRGCRQRAEAILEEASQQGWLEAATAAFVRDRLQIEFPDQAMTYTTVAYWVKQYKSQK